MSEKAKDYKSDNKKLITRLEQSKAQYEKNNDILHTNYQIKMEQTEKEKEQLSGIIADLEHHNQQLQTVVSSKTAEIKEYLKRVEN
jgi:predicted phage tail protein